MKKRIFELKDGTESLKINEKADGGRLDKREIFERTTNSILKYDEVRRVRRIVESKFDLCSWGQTSFAHRFRVINRFFKRSGKRAGRKKKKAVEDAFEQETITSL